MSGMRWAVGTGLNGICGFAKSWPVYKLYRNLNIYSFSGCELNKYSTSYYGISVKWLTV